MPKLRVTVKFEHYKTPPSTRSAPLPPPCRKTERTNNQDGRMEPSSRVFLPIQSSLEEETVNFHDERTSAQNSLRVRALSLSSSIDPSSATPAHNNTYFISAKDVTPAWPLIPESSDLDEYSGDTRPRLEMRISPRR
jgi:hypothetical protein